MSAAASVRRQRSASKPSPRSNWRARAKAPVRVAYIRHEELSVTGYRPATEMKIALLPSAQGELKALVADRLLPTPAPRPIPPSRALARLIYPAEAQGDSPISTSSAICRRARPFRGPGRTADGRLRWSRRSTRRALP
jgi:CO/xanthine dehydrogenase Mo-binding subunit